MVMNSRQWLILLTSFGALTLGAAMGIVWQQRATGLAVGVLAVGLAVTVALFAKLVEARRREKSL